MVNTAQIDALCSRLVHRKTVGSYHCALDTLVTLRGLISSLKFSHASDIIDFLRAIALRLMHAQPIEIAVDNIVKRILHIVREEEIALTTSPDMALSNSLDVFDSARRRPSLDIQSSAVPSSRSSVVDINRLSRKPSFSNPDRYSHLDADKNLSDSDGDDSMNLKASVIQTINELKDEIETSRSNIAAQAHEHIHSNEIILTLGKSLTVEKFLKEAARYRKFQVIVIETAPTCNGHVMAKSLAEMGIETTVIPDSAIFAVMSRVSKIILSAHAIKANGGMVATSGTLVVANAAKHYSTPVVVCSGLYKLSPMYPYDVDKFMHYVNPQAVLPYHGNT